MATQLEQLRNFTTVVADTGDLEAMRRYRPQDATTNPSLILKAAQDPRYVHLLDRAAADGKGSGAAVPAVMNAVLVAFGREILEIVPGRVSTEVDARLSFDTEATVALARELIALYESLGTPRERVLIKIASTWEGIQAAAVLEREGIHCNLTLMFSLVQAAACAEAGVRLISPFVGRIYDWFRKETGVDYQGADDPGVQSVQRIYAYYRHHGIATEIMGASFRNVGQILELAGCDLLTISPDLLGELEASEAEVTPKLSPAYAESCEREEVPGGEKAFRYLLNEDAMATEKTAQGIRAFAADIVKLERLIEERLEG